MKNEDLLKLKIKIGCKNNLAYQDIAYLVDKPEFLKLLPTLRKKYSIEKLIPLKKFGQWWEEKIRDDLISLSKNKKLLRSAKEFIRQYKKDPSNTQKLFNMLPFHQKFDWETQFLTRRFKRPGYFHLVIKHAIVCGEGNDESWQPTYIDIFPPELPIEDVPLPEVTIFISPMTKLRDIKKVFKENVPQIFEDNKEALKYFSKIRKGLSDCVRRDRKWYWENIKGKSYTQIALSVSKDDKEDYKKFKDRNRLVSLPMVRQAIRRYKKILKSW